MRPYDDKILLAYFREMVALLRRYESGKSFETSKRGERDVQIFSS